MKISNNLKMLRVKYGFTQCDIASYLGISIITYNHKENGKSNFGLPEAIKLAELFNLTVDDIFFNCEVHEKHTNAFDILSTET